jgi:hypothetical protein
MNEGIARARGTYVGVIECDGRYRRDRVEAFVRLLAGLPASWGFSNVAFVDVQGNPVRYGESPRVDAAMRDFDALYASGAVSEVFLDRDFPLAAGNLFFEKSLWRQASQIPTDGSGSALAFCLSAMLHAEPAYFDEPAYVLQLSADAEGDPSVEHRAEERRRMRANLEAAEADAMTNTALQRIVKRRRRARDFALMTGGHGDQLARSQLLRYAAELGFAPPPLRQ